LSSQLLCQGLAWHCLTLALRRAVRVRARKHLHACTDAKTCTCTRPARSYEVDALPDVATPDHLVPPEEMLAKVQQYQPKFVPLEEGSSDGEWAGAPPAALQGPSRPGYSSASLAVCCLRVGCRDGTGKGRWGLCRQGCVSNPHLIVMHARQGCATPHSGACAPREHASQPCLRVRYEPRNRHGTSQASGRWEGRRWEVAWPAAALQRCTRYQGLPRPNDCLPPTWFVVPDQKLKLLQGAAQTEEVWISDQGPLTTTTYQDPSLPSSVLVAHPSPSALACTTQCGLPHNVGG